MNIISYVRNLFRCSVAVFALCLPYEASAVPAYPGLLQVRQPDGTYISIQKIGDERGHIVLSSDGYLLTELSDGYYYYSLPDGKISPMRAAEPKARTAEAVKLLTSIDQRAVIKEYAARINSFSSVYDDFRKAPVDITPVLPSNPIPGVFDGSNFPSKGKHKVLIFLVQYPDVNFTIENPKAYFTNMLNKKGFSENGCSMSVRDFYLESSMGAFDPEFVVYGPLTLKNPQKYYGDNLENGEDRAAYEMVIEACDAYDSEIDFKEFDADGNGLIDNIYVFYAGRGEATGGSASTVWPHSYDVSAKVKKYYDGVQLSTYGCSNELMPRNNSRELFPDAIGTFCHEFGHVLGLPDLYSTSYVEDVHHPGPWSVMASGSYNNNGCTPPTYSSFERAALGWLDPEPISSGDFVLPPLKDSNKAFIVPTEKNTEFFLLENRQLQGADEFLPGAGMLVWHIDYDSSVWNRNICNNNPEHQYIDIVEAHGLTNILRMLETFPGLNDFMDFTAETNPALRSWSGAALGVSIKNITFRDFDDMNSDVLFSAEVKKAAGIENTVTGTSLVRVDGLTLYIDSDGMASARVFTPDGMFVGSLQQGGCLMLPSAGIYLVKTTDETLKIAVR